MAIMAMTRHNALRASLPLIQRRGYLLGRGTPRLWLSVALRAHSGPTMDPLTPHRRAARGWPPHDRPQGGLVD